MSPPSDLATSVPCSFAGVTPKFETASLLTLIATTASHAGRRRKYIGDWTTDMVSMARRFG